VHADLDSSSTHSMARSPTRLAVAVLGCRRRLEGPRKRPRQGILTSALLRVPLANSARAAPTRQTIRARRSCRPRKRSSNASTGSIPNASALRPNVTVNLSKNPAWPRSTAQVGFHSSIKPTSACHSTCSDGSSSECRRNLTSAKRTCRIAPAATGQSVSTRQRIWRLGVRIPPGAHKTAAQRPCSKRSIMASLAVSIVEC
jgi:hypothetical protein